MTDTGDSAAIDALNAVMTALSRLDTETRRRVLQSVVTFFSMRGGETQTMETNLAQPLGPRAPGFSVTHIPSPKEFLMEKQPRTDVERIACLAYYLAHYRDMPHFKTLDLGKLNTEAAQPKFSNAAYASQNALKMRYLAPATKGQRQLSAAGEQFVSALPDREGAKLAMAMARPHRKAHKKRAKSQMP